MRIDKARYLADMLFLVHNMKGWEINFISLGKVHGSHPFGICDDYAKTIILDRFVVERMYEYEYNDLLIHEFAHAVLFNKYNHNFIFRNKVKELGGRSTQYLHKIDWRKRPIKWMPRI